MTYRDPNAPPPGDAPTESYRVVDGAAPGTSAADAREPVVTPATTSRVQSGGPRRGLRWAVALVVVALVATSAAAAVFLMAGKAPDAAVLGWMPEDSVMYMEARLDLPGDQRANLGSFLSKFPGFKDQANLETKVNEALDRLVSEATEGGRSWSADIAPWFGGELAFGLGRLPEIDENDPEAMVETADMVALISVSDAAKAQAWFDAAVADASPTTETYNGTTLTIVGSGLDGDVQMAYAVAGNEVVVAGPLASVKRSLDTQGGSGFATSEAFAAANASSDQDHVGFLYVDMASYMDWMLSVGDVAGAEGCGMQLTAQMRDLVPAWMAGRLRLEGDALVMSTVAPKPATVYGPQENARSVLATRVPASTITFLETRQLGQSILDMIELYRNDPACEEAFREIEPSLGMVGGLDHLLGWIGDTAIVVNRTADGVEGGLVIQTADAASARNLTTMLRSALSLAGEGIELRDETHGDATITVVDLGDASQFLGMAGMMGGVDVPVTGQGDRVELAWTVTDDLVVLSVGPSFVRSVLDTEESASLATSDRFEALLDRAAGAENAGVAYTDLTAVRELLEGVARESGDFSQYEAEVKPFIEPFDALLFTNSIDDELRSEGVITIKE